MRSFKKRSVYSNRLHLPKVASPWLPPLKERIAAEDIQDIQFKHYWGENKHPEFLLGYQDIPEQQAQLPLTVDFNDCGHILVVGSQGMGSLPLSKMH